eukprot:gene4891-8698_t
MTGTLKIYMDSSAGMNIATRYLLLEAGAAGTAPPPGLTSLYGVSVFLRHCAVTLSTDAADICAGCVGCVGQAVCLCALGVREERVRGVACVRGMCFVCVGRVWSVEGLQGV